MIFFIISINYFKDIYFLKQKIKIETPSGN